MLRLEMCYRLKSVSTAIISVSLGFFLYLNKCEIKTFQLIKTLRKILAHIEILSSVISNPEPASFQKFSKNRCM